MILESLAVTDFRVFEGRHIFDLAPRVNHGKKRPVVLFGGLNGAGKTTTLTAVRLALYGKQCLGMGVSQKAYEAFLAKCIHKSNASLIRANSSTIELTFSYASMGTFKHYTVKRSWVIAGKKLAEELSIIEDEETLSELNHDQCQGFLNELIPIGVSDLFFFDGEKIAELAEDTSGLALGESIKKLLGLDLVETLDADLGLIKRNESKKSAPKELRKEIEKLESELLRSEKNANAALDDWEKARACTEEHTKNLERHENDLASQGGAWAATREKEIAKESELRAEKLLLETQLREIIAEYYPLSIAGDFATHTVKQLNKERLQSKKQATADLIESHLRSLDKELSGLLDENNHTKVRTAINKEFVHLQRRENDQELIHDLSESAIQRIESVVKSAISQQGESAKNVAKRLNETCEKLDKAGLNIARAPEEEAIKPAMDRIRKSQKKREESLIQESVHLERHKSSLRTAMDITRKLDKVSEHVSFDEKSDRVLLYANKSRSLLKDFSNELAKRKVHDLEQEFMNSFHRLARKDDISLSAEIDPSTFAVRLIDKNQQEIDKNDLSAGEKQIYAISILEALGKTSGRKLPIIIDTPLGRLDSKHRENLINNYFPTASHQVIILSTDTEVDESFYSDLSSSISHAFKLGYDSTSGSTTAEEGYFWKSKKGEAA